MGAFLRYCRDFKWHPLALDHALALFILGINLFVPGGGHVGERIELNGTIVVLAVVGAAALAFRRSAPLLVLGVTSWCPCLRRTSLSVPLSSIAKRSIHLLKKKLKMR